MPVEVIMPKVDMDMTHGTVSVWHVGEGETVAKGAALFDIETDKAAMEVEAPAAGRLHHIVAREGDRVAVGAPVAWLYAEGETVGDPPAATPDAAPRAASSDAEPSHPGAAVDAREAASVAGAPAAAGMSGGGPEDRRSLPAGDLPAARPGGGILNGDLRLRATPAARAAARACGLELADVPGTGPRGRIQKDDVAGHARQPSSAGIAGAGGATAFAAEPGPLAVTRRGNGAGLPLVLLHGFAADSQSWAPLASALGAERTIVRIDLPGHGRSPKRRISGFPGLARMIVEAFDDAVRDLGPVHLVGHSLGGALALALADIRPRKVASLSLISPAGLGPEIDAATLFGVARASREESLGPWLRRLTAEPEATSDAYIRAAMASRRDPALRACQLAMAESLFPDGVQAFDLRPALSRLDLPAQILWGRRDHILPFRQALAVPGDFGIHLLGGAGHVPQIECPDRVARILTRLFAGVAASA